MSAEVLAAICKEDLHRFEREQRDSMAEIAESSLTRDLVTVHLDAIYGFISEFTSGMSTPCAELWHDGCHEDAPFDVEAGSLMLWNGLVEIATDIGRLMTVEEGPEDADTAPFLLHFA